MKQILGLPAEDFFVPDDVLDFYRAAGGAARPIATSGASGSPPGRRRIPRRASEHEACLEGRGLEGWEAKLPTWQPGDKLATRVASGKVLAAIFDVVPGLVGGGADLSGNTGTLIDTTTRSPRATRAGGSSTSVCASTRWARS